MSENQADFRETITASAVARGRFSRQTGGRSVYADVWLKVEPLKRGKGFEFVNAVAEGVLPQEYFKPIEEGVREAMEHGLLRGHPMTDLRVILLDGSYHRVDSSASAFKSAGLLGFKEAVRKANPIILEPDAD
jgi:elongation factor G